MMQRRASTPCLSFSSLDEGSFKADHTDAAVLSNKSALSLYSDASKQRRKSLGDFGIPLPLLMPPLRVRPSSATAMSIDLKDSCETTKIVQAPLVVEDERTALARCLHEELQAKKSLVFAMTQGDPSVLAEAIANARLKCVDDDKLVKAEALLKQLRASKVRKQVQKCGSSSLAPLTSTLPEASRWKPRSTSKQLNRASISPEAQAVLAGMIEAQSFISQGFEDRKSVCPAMHRRRRSSLSDASQEVCPAMHRRSVSLTSIRVR